MVQNLFCEKAKIMLHVYVNEILMLSVQFDIVI
jgi:hypothetical protein